jgi:hypothetical protein
MLNILDYFNTNNQTKQIMELVKFEQFGLNEDQAKQITKDLPAILSERDILAARYVEIMKMDINDPETTKAASEHRKLIKNNRTQGVEKWHKANKEFYLRGGQFVDAIKNKEIAENKRMEDALEAIEKHAERLEAERLMKLNQERIDLISPYMIDTTGLRLCDMDEDVFEAYFSAKKKAHEDRIEAERKAEEERIERERKEQLSRDRVFKTSRLVDFISEYDSIQWGEISDSDFESIVKGAIEKRKAHEAEQERIKIENERLKKEAEEKEAKLKAEQEARDKKEKEAARLRAIEEAKKQAELDRIKAELEAERKAEQERIAKEKAEQEAKLKAEQELAKAGDNKRIKAWIDSMVIKPIGTENMKPESIEICNEIFAKFEVK